MKYLVLVLLLAGCLGDDEAMKALDKKYSVNNYFENERQIPDGKIPSKIFIILKKKQAKKWDEVEARFEELFNDYPASQAVKVEHVHYLYEREKWDDAIAAANKYGIAHPHHVELKIYNEWLSKIKSGQEGAKDSMEGEFKIFRKMSKKFVRDKMMEARNKKKG
jgi:outer membrane protein assembly factor BamD (BamD/ComL family)